MKQLSGLFKLVAKWRISLDRPPGEMCFAVFSSQLLKLERSHLMTAAVTLMILITDV